MTSEKRCTKWQQQKTLRKEEMFNWFDTENFGNLKENKTKVELNTIEEINLKNAYVNWLKKIG